MVPVAAMVARRKMSQSPGNCVDAQNSSLVFCASVANLRQVCRVAREGALLRLEERDDDIEILGRGHKGTRFVWGLCREFCVAFAQDYGSRD